MAWMIFRASAGKSSAKSQERFGFSGGNTTARAAS
jgi:hypothetical protein